MYYKVVNRMHVFFWFLVVKLAFAFGKIFLFLEFILVKIVSRVKYMILK